MSPVALTAVAVFLALLSPFIACAQSSNVLPQAAGWTLAPVAESPSLWTGVAVSRQGRIFVNFPRWSPAVEASLGELLPDGSVRSYPSEEWNRYESGAEAARRFVCVQSVVVDDADHLWILDTGNPLLGGVVPGGPKLIEVDLSRDRVVRTVPFDTLIAPRRSYLNDLRVDTRTSTVYMTESGLGALVVVDLASGRARRVLADHPSTKWEHTAVVVGGRPWVAPGGPLPEVHADGIGLSPDGRYVYYQALCGRTLYRVPTAALRDASLTEEALGREVERVGRTGVADGILFDRAGNLYLTALEADAIHRLTTGGRLEAVVQDARIEWPDSFALGPDGSLYFTTSRIHRAPNPAEPYRIMKLTPPR